MNKKRNTILLFIIIALLVLAGLLINHLIFGETGTTAIIWQDGKIIAELDLTKEKEMTINDSDGGRNVIIIKNGTISVDDADCPDLVCVRTGAISHTGEVIACLPHKLIITIKDSKQNDVDSTVW